MSYPSIDWNEVEAIQQRWGQPVVAIAYERGGEVHDHCFTWETGQSIALNGYRVRAIARDGHMSIRDAQRLYDSEYTAYRDCFGITV